MNRPLWILLLAGTVAMLCFPDRVTAAGVQPSKWVYPSHLGDLLYGSDTNGVRINDFSNCGYKRGEVALPEIQYLVPSNQWIQLSPLSNGRDNTTLINGALQAIGVRPTNAFGFRGVVYLDPGEYRVDSTIWMTNSGVVLKGAGSSPTTGTRLRATFARSDDLISVLSDSGPVTSIEANSELAEWLVPAGTHTFRVNRPENLQVGQWVSVVHPGAQDWMHALDMDRLNGEWIAVDASTGGLRTADHARRGRLDHSGLAHTANFRAKVRRRQNLDHGTGSARWELRSGGSIVLVPAKSRGQRERLSILGRQCCRSRGHLGAERGGRRIFWGVCDSGRIVEVCHRGRM